MTTLFRKHSRSLTAVAAVSLTCTSAAFAARTTESGRIVHESAPSSAERGKLVIRNVAWDSVRVEVRIGGATDCELNSLVGVHSILRGRSWAISTDKRICWRRERSPGGRPTAIWTGWSQRKLPPGRVERAHP